PHCHRRRKRAERGGQKDARMTKTDNPADPFKKALTEATRALAADAELEVAFTADPSGVSGERMRLPQISRRMTRDEVRLARGTADALALRLRHHDDAVHARYTPAGPIARELYEAMESARCEALGARDMPGALTNIDAKLSAEALRRGYDRVSETEASTLPAAAGLVLRQLATGRALPPEAGQLADPWRPLIEAQAGETLEGLREALADRAGFARL